MSSDWSRKREREGEEKDEGNDSSVAQHLQAQPPSPTHAHGQPPPPSSHPNASRYAHPGGRAPEGYYQPHYPPPGDGSAPPYPPPRGYEGAPPYGMPPPHMAGYPMYPYQPPMYPHYPGYPPPHMPYGYPPPDPSMGGGHPPPPQGYPPREDQGANVGPYQSATSTPTKLKEPEEDDRKPASREEQPTEPGDLDDDDDSEIVPGAVTARLKTYIKPRIPTTQDVLDRRSRKNAQSRARAAKLRHRIVDIEKKTAEERTEEEQQIFLQFEARRQRKNDRSRERAMEKKEEIDRILAKSEKKRTKIEKQFLENALSAKKRKNEGDRLRRQRLKHLGVSSKGSGSKPGVSARGPLPPSKVHAYYPGYPPHMGEIPMSPMPPMGHHHMQSPGAFGSPGMMHMGYPSPQHVRRPGPPGVMETPGRPGPHMPYMPPNQSYDNQGSPPASYQHQHPSSRVEQRRHPDGSMSISIGGGGAAGSSFGGETRMHGAEEQNMNISDVSHLLLYDNGEEGEGGQNMDPSNGEDKSEL